jgi:hypothetical protein
MPGKEVEAIKFGTEIAKMVADIVGVEVMFGQQVGGPIGQVGWRATYADMAAFEKAMTKSSPTNSRCRSIKIRPPPTRAFGQRVTGLQRTLAPLAWLRRPLRKERFFCN